MTNTIPNVPRELLERAWRALANSATGREIGAYLDADPCAPECAETCARASMCATCSANLSAPSPAGVDGLACAAALLLPALRQYMHNDGTGLLAGYDLETTEAIIDGLRGENERIRLNIAEYNEAISCYQSERDQQAQRIGELEGLLRAESARVDFLDAHIVTADAPNTGKVAMLADSGTLRECIDAALSAGKEGSDGVNTL